MGRYASVPEDWTADGVMPEAVARYEADIQHLEALFDAPLSPERRKRTARLLQEWQAALEGLDWQGLSLSDRTDALLLLRHIRLMYWLMEEEELRFRQVCQSLPQAEELVGMLDAHRRLEDLEPRSCAEILTRTAEALQELTGKLESGAVAGVTAVRLWRFLRDLPRVLTAWRDFWHGYEPFLTWWVQQPYDELNRRLTECIEKAEKTASGDDKAAIIGDPVGREALEKDLSLEMIPYTPEELIEVGQREAEWCRTEMRKAAAEMGCGDDWRAALEKVKQDHVPPGEQARFVRELAREAVTFLEERQLIRVPELARDGWHIEMMSPDRQRVNPFFLGGDRIVVSYPKSDMTHSEKLMSMRANNRHFSRATVQHELIPGHYLQHFSRERYRRYRRLFYTPFWTEGWALYWEMRLWELGFPRTPEERMGMLFWRLHRAARIIFSLRFHLGEMTTADCVEMLVNEVGHERSTAEGEVRRSFGGEYPPLYQCGYLIGGLQFRALHRELVEAGGMSERDFHERVLRENCMPVAVLRAVLSGEELSKDWRPSWRFV